MNTVCASCQALNRLPDDRSADGAKCGRCGHDLFDGDVINATGATLDKLLEGRSAGRCRFLGAMVRTLPSSFAPIFEDVAEERSGKMRFVKVNTEAERELSARFRIRSIPTIMMFKNGEVIDMLNGAVPKAPFDSWLNEAGQQ